MMERRQELEYRRLARALARSVDDPEAFAVAVSIHRELGEALATRAQEMTDPELPPMKRFSWRDLAAVTGLAKSTLFDVFGPKPPGASRRSPLGLRISSPDEPTWIA